MRSGGAGALCMIKGRRDHIQHDSTVEVVEWERSQPQEGLDQGFAREWPTGRCRERHQMMIEDRLEPSLVGFQRASHHADLIETVAIHFNQGQDFTADRRQLLFDPDHARDGEFDQLCRCGSLPFPTPILVGVCQREKMALKKLAGKVKSRAVL